MGALAVDPQELMAVAAAVAGLGEEAAALAAGTRDASLLDLQVGEVVGALYELVSRWQWALGEVAGGCADLAAALQQAAAGYAATESDVASATGRMMR